MLKYSYAVNFMKDIAKLRLIIEKQRWTLDFAPKLQFLAHKQA